MRLTATEKMFCLKEVARELGRQVIVMASLWINQRIELKGQLELFSEVY